VADHGDVVGGRPPVLGDPHVDRSALREQSADDSGVEDDLAPTPIASGFTS
jgi:hypothetical protein